MFIATSRALNLPSSPLDSNRLARARRAPCEASGTAGPSLCSIPS